MENKRVPKIRFAGFTGDWEQRELGEVVDVIDGDRGKNYPKNNDFTTEGHTLFLSANNITRDGFSFEITQFISKEKSDSMGNGRVSLNDIILTSRGTIGNIALYGERLNTVFKHVRINSGMLILRTYKETDSMYIVQYLKSPIGTRQINLISFGSAQPQITKKDVKSYKLSLPQIKEQEKIGSFFRNIDETIALHQQELDTLKQTKQGLLEKVFSQEIRFTNENEENYPDWKKTALSEVLSIPKKEVDKDVSRNKLLTVKLHRKGVEGNQNTATLKIGSTNYYKRKAGQFIYGKQNFFNGAFDIIPDKYDGYLSSGDVPTLDIGNNKLSPLFLLYYVGRKSFYKRAEKYSSGTGSKRIHESTLLEIKIDLPKMEEQQKIGQFFKQLDDTIALHEQELETLKQTKKAFLQKMFV